MLGEIFLPYSHNEVCDIENLGSVFALDLVGFLIFLDFVDFLL